MGKKLKDKIEIGLKEVIILTTLIITSAMIANASTNILNSGSSDTLVAEYRFDTGTGNTAYDTAGNNDGTINGATWTSGVKGKALIFDGNDDYLASEYSVAGSDAYPEGLTVSSWVYREDGGTGSRTRIVSTDASEYWSLDQDSGTGNGDNSVSAYVNVDGSTYFLDSQDSLPLNRWSHVVLTWDPETTQMKLYRDGEEVASRSTGSNLGSGTTRYLTIGDGSEAGSFDGGRNNAYFGGKVDSTRIYEEDLNLSQIRSMYNSGAWRIGSKTEEDDPSKILDMSFQHQNSSHVLDTSGYNNHGERMDGVNQESAVNCKVGRCYSSDGSDDYIEVSGLPDFSNGNEVTVSAWAKSENENWGGTGWIASKRGQFIIHPNSGTKRVKFYVKTGSSGWTNVAYSPGDITKWHHYSLSYDGSVLKAYVDGEEVGSTKINEELRSDTGPMTIGRDDGRNRYGSGKIDQVKIFNRSLSQQEIIDKTQGLEGGGTVLDLRFNRDGGDRVNDYSGENNHASINGGDWVESRDGNALELESGENVDIPNSNSIQSALNGEGATIAFWVDLGQIDSSWNTWFPWTATNDLGSQSARLEQEGDGDNIYTRWIVDPASAGFAGDGGVWARGLPDMRGKRFLHVSTFETTDSGYRVRTFINDEIASETTSSENAVLADASGIGSFSPAQATNIIDNLKIYPYAISKSKVQQLYSRGKSQIGSSSSSSSTNLQDGLVLSQTFNRIETCGQSDTISCPSGVSGEVAVDESGEANHGELVNGPTEKNAGDCRSGGCLGFDGSDDYVEIPDTPNSANKAPFTYSAWVYIDNKTGSNQYILSNGAQSYSEGASMSYSDSSEKITFSVQGSNRNADIGVSAEANKWYHVVGKWDNTSNTNAVKLYLNGELRAKGTVSSQRNDAQISGITVGTPDNSKGHYVFNGKIDNSRIYNRSLSNEEVWKLYTRGRDREQGMAGPVGHWRLDSETYDASGEGNHGNNENGVRKAYVSGNLNFNADQWNGGGNNGEFDITCPGSDSSCWFEDANGNQSSLTINNGVACQDGASGTGYIMYSYENVHTRFSSNDPHPDNAENFICARYNNGWEYDTNNNWIDFNPVENDTLVASVDFDGDTVSKLTYYPEPVNGKVGEALKFDGSEDYVRISDNPELDTDEITVSAWFKIRRGSLDFSGPVRSIITRDENSEERAWKIGIEDSGIYHAEINADTRNVITPSNTVEEGVWTHVTLSYNGSTSKLYENGELIATASNSGPLNHVSQAVDIGAPAELEDDRYFNGKIDDVRVYPYALNQDQVKQVMNGGSASIG